MLSQLTAKFDIVAHFVNTHAPYFTGALALAVGLFLVRSLLGIYAAWKARTSTTEFLDTITIQTGQLYSAARSLIIGLSVLIPVEHQHHKLIVSLVCIWAFLVALSIQALSVMYVRGITAAEARLSALESKVLSDAVTFFETAVKN